LRDRRAYARPSRPHPPPRRGARADRGLRRGPAARARRRAATLLLSLRALGRRNAPGGDRRRLALRGRRRRQGAHRAGDRPLRHAQGRSAALDDALRLQDPQQLSRHRLDPHMTPITAIIVTYQSARTIGDALAAARRCHDAGLLDLVVVDNASRDATPTILAREAGWARVLLEPANHGFGRGCNLGLAHAKRS